MGSNMNYDLNAFVTKDLVEQKKPIRFMYKEQADNVNDSGWRFFSGDEPQEYVDNADNIIMCSLHDVINNIDTSIVAHLDAEVGIAFERENENDEFLEIKDYKLDSELE